MSKGKAEKAAPPHAIVIGAGLAGMSATFELLERGCFVTIIDKSHHFPPGNSHKASIGLCAPGINMEGMKLDAQDSMADVMVDSGDNFMANSTSDVEWLLSRFMKIENDQHTQDDAATLSDFCSVTTPGKKGNNCVIGAKNALIGTVMSGQAWLCVAKLSRTSLLEVIRGGEVLRLLQENGKVVGCEYLDTDGMTSTIMGTVVLATGGYGGTGEEGSLMAKFNPTGLSENTLSGERVDGRGIEMAMEVGAGVERLDEVNLYPLAASFDGTEDDDRVRILISTLLLGAGGVLLDASGKRFCDEKGTDPADITRMMKTSAKGPFRLVVHTEDLPQNVQWICDWYMKNKILKVKSPGNIAQEMGVDVSLIEAATGTRPQASGGRQLYTQEVAPAIYTCTGGIKVKKETGQVTSDRGYVIDGLYAAGEAACGPSQKMYAKTGVPLLHCVYSGKAAGFGAATYMNGGKEPVKKDITSLLEWLKVGTEDPKTERQVSQDSKKATETDLQLKTKEDLIALVLKMREAGPPAAPVAEAAPAVPEGPPPITVDDVAKHNTKEDAWLIVNGEVVDVTGFIQKHPGGVQAICQYLGKDASEEWNTIHKKGMVQSRGVPLGAVILGPLGTGAPAAGGGGGAPKDDGIPWSEIEQHNKKENVWVVINGEVIDASEFIDKHPGGVPALMQYAGKDASEEWNTIHKPGTVQKVGVKLGAKVLGKAAGGGSAPPPQQDTGYVEPDSPDGYGALYDLPEAIAKRIEGNGMSERRVAMAEKFRSTLGKFMQAVLRGPIGALIYLAIGLLTQVAKTVLWTGNLKFNNERLGTIRSGLFLVLFTVLHSSDNQFTQLGKKQYNGMSFFLADTMQKVKGYQLFDMYIGLCVLLHVSVGLKRSWDLNMGYLISTGKWNYMLTGLCILGFLTSHLIDFRFAELFHEDGYVPTPKMYVPPYGVVVRKEPPFAFFYQDAAAPTDCLLSAIIGPSKDFLCGPGKEVQIRDLFTVCHRIFQSPQKVLAYVGFCAALVAHLSLVWPKIVTAGSFQIPRDHQETVKLIGLIAAVVCGTLYVSVPIRFYLGIIPPP
jgi:succinate dehydrogenase/fumarate reductase flavoprotein subunit/predicted heme/steroid binding protein